MSGDARRHVLVVDDEGAIRALLRAVFAGMGYEVTEAESGAIGLEAAETRGPFTLVVSDIVMAGIDGIDMARSIADAGRARRFLFISGYANTEQVGSRLADLPTAAFLPKPFSISDLMRTVNGLLEQEPEAHRAA